MYIHVGTAWQLKGHNPGLKGFRCVQLHNFWWQQIPIPHCFGEQNVGQKEDFMHSNFQMDISLPWIDAAFT
jgi:hypothetical protein